MEQPNSGVSQPEARFWAPELGLVASNARPRRELGSLASALIRLSLVAFELELELAIELAFELNSTRIQVASRCELGSAFTGFQLRLRLRFGSEIRDPIRVRVRVHVWLRFIRQTHNSRVLQLVSHLIGVRSAAPICQPNERPVALFGSRLEARDPRSEIRGWMLDAASSPSVR